LIILVEIVWLVELVIFVNSVRLTMLKRFVELKMLV
jgi:hypothetical protein